MSLQSLYNGATGMIAQNQHLEVISNNLANVSTDGFKKSRANFEDLLYKNVKIPGAGNPGDNATPTVGLQFGVGARVSGTQLSFEQGALKQTGKPLDVAITGSGVGFFRVADPQGSEFYTRAGNFTLNSNGQVIMATASRGLVLQPAITIPPDATSISISADGQVSVTQAGNNQATQVGQIDGVRFPNPEGLQQVGENLYVETSASGAAEIGQFAQQGFGNLSQSFLEASNVEPVKELIDLITSQRAFELNSQVIQTANDNLRVVNTLRQ